MTMHYNQEKNNKYIFIFLNEKYFKHTHTQQKGAHYTSIIYVFYITSNIHHFLKSKQNFL